MSIKTFLDMYGLDSCKESVDEWSIGQAIVDEEGFARPHVAAARAQTQSNDCYG
jgi:hypothetical protein